MIHIDTETAASIRDVPYFRESQYVNLDVPATLEYFKKRFVDHILLDPITPHHTLTDIGTGFGWLAMALALHTPARIIAIDPDEPRLNAAASIAAALGVGDRIDWRKGSATHLPMASRESDVTFCIEVLEHVQRDPEVFRELDRVTGRYLVFTTPNGAFPVIAHDTQLPFCHWLPMNLRNFYARAFGRAHLQEGNRFWTPADVRNHLSHFRRVSGFLHFRDVNDYFKLYPYYQPYGVGRWRQAPSTLQKYYYKAVGRLGRFTPYLMPALSGTFERIGG